MVPRLVPGSRPRETGPEPVAGTSSHYPGTSGNQWEPVTPNQSTALDHLTVWGRRHPQKGPTMTDTPNTDRPSAEDSMRQMLRFHMDRAERHRLRAEKAEAELEALKKKEAHP